MWETLLARERVRRALAHRPLVVDLQIDGLSDCHLLLFAEGFRLDPGLADRSHLSVRAPYALVASLADGVTALVKTLLAELVRGRMRVRGIVRSGPRLAALLFSVLRGR